MTVSIIRTLVYQCSRCGDLVATAGEGSVPRIGDPGSMHWCSDLPGCPRCGRDPRVTFLCACDAYPHMALESVYMGYLDVIDCGDYRLLVRKWGT